MTDNTPELKEIARHLKDIAQSQRDQLRILKTLSSQLLKASSNEIPSTTSTYSEEVTLNLPSRQPKTYGWSMAAAVQRDGDLNVGDIKVEQDDSRWVWTGEIWERTELPRNSEAS